MTIYEKIWELHKEFDEKLKALMDEASEDEQKEVTRFEPEIDGEYSFITTVGSPCTVYWHDDEDEGLDGSRQKFCNVFRTSSEENLKKYAHDVLRVQNRLMQLHEELCPGYWPDWKDGERKYCLSYASERNEWVVVWTIDNNDITVYFPNEAAQKAREILNSERFMMEDQNG